MKSMKTVDLMVLGATGFTGKVTVKLLAEIVRRDYSGIIWGISGRSTDKMQNLLSEIKETGHNTRNIPVLECDIKNQESVRNVANVAHVLINCTGPHTTLSEPVVQACIEMGTHYLDISAELFHILKLYRKYNQAAQDANVLVIPSCGFSALPVDTGLSYLERNFKGTLETVACYAELQFPKRALFPGCCLVHYGTWESLVHVLKNFNEYLQLKRQTFPEPLAPETDEMKKSFFHRHEGKFWFPYPGTENDVSEMSQRYLRDKKQKMPVYFKSYTTVPLFIHFIIVPVFFIYYYLSWFKCFRWLLKTYPRFFTVGYMSHKGPSENRRNDTKFTFTLNGKGWSGDVDKTKPTKSMTLKISGSDPGYRTTALTIICAAITIMKEANNMPKGGVIMPGAAFHDTAIVNKLSAEGVSYDLCEKE